METKHLDNLINDLETLKSKNWLSELGQETLNEYKAIKQALSQHDVIKNEVAVCLITDEQQKCSYRSEGKCLYKNACAHKQTVL